MTLCAEVFAPRRTTVTFFVVKSTVEKSVDVKQMVPQLVKNFFFLWLDSP
jgi:hypothetical protein